MDMDQTKIRMPSLPFRSLATRARTKSKGKILMAQLPVELPGHRIRVEMGREALWVANGTMLCGSGIKEVDQLGIDSAYYALG